MTLPIIRYELDTTGVNPDNLIVGEVHALSARDVRAVAPSEGPFYADSVVVYDNITGTKLTKGTQYVFVELLQDVTLRYGKDVYGAILIIDTDVSSTIRLNYQCLGGVYKQNTTAIYNMYESVMNDNRAVDWNNVLNKPTEFNPAIHRHLLEDMYGFEPVVVALERIRNAIILNDVPAFEYLIDYLNESLDNIKKHLTDYDNPHKTDKIQVGLSLLENMRPVTRAMIIEEYAGDGYLTYDAFKYFYGKYLGGVIDYKITASTKELGESYAVYLFVETANIPDNSYLYWTIDHISTEPEDFSANKGRITIINNKAVFFVTVNKDNLTDVNETFRVFLRTDSVEGTVKASSDKINIITDYLIDAYKETDIATVVEHGNVFSPAVRATAQSISLMNLFVSDPNRTLM